MTVRRLMAVSVVAAAALLASPATPVPTFGVSAQAQGKDGKGPGGGNGPGGANRSSPPGEASPPPRTNSPTINRGPGPRPNATPDRPGPGRIVQRPRDVTPNRIVIREGDRRRNDGDRRRGTRYVWGPGIAFYFYDGFYHGDCSWLRRKARETGSRYWRQRYEQCRDE